MRLRTIANVTPQEETVEPDLTGAFLTLRVGVRPIDIPAVGE